MSRIIYLCFIYFLFLGNSVIFSNPIISVSFTEDKLVFKNLFNHPGFIKTSKGVFELDSHLSEYKVLMDSQSDYLLVYNNSEELISFFCWGNVSNNVLDEAEKAELWHGKCIPSGSWIVGYRSHSVLYYPLRSEYYFPVYLQNGGSSTVNSSNKVYSYRFENVHTAPFYGKDFSIYTIQGRRIPFGGWGNLGSGIYLIHYQEESYLYAN